MGNNVLWGVLNALTIVDDEVPDRAADGSAGRTTHASGLKTRLTHRPRASRAPEKRALGFEATFEAKATTPIDLKKNTL